MNPNEPSPAKPPRPPSPGGIEGLDPAELLARALNTAQPSAGATAWLPPAPEELARLLPQYGIESLLGHGGMGAVYKGRQPDLDRPVAIKLLPAEIAADEQFIARFRREARMLAKLQHSGIVSVYDFGQTSEGHLYIVMEFVDGTDLQRILRGPGLEPAQALNLISQVCDALHYAHSKGVIHRDIKPGNILVNTEGWVKLADFGLARPVNQADTLLTGSNVIMGTADYMAPEQRDGHADQRADIYALGVMLYEMLTGKRPHGVFDLPSHRVVVDIRLDEVVLKAMQQEPERRYQQVSEMKTDVDTIRHTPQPSPGADLPETEVDPRARNANPAPRPPVRPRRPVVIANQARARLANPGHATPEAILKTTSSINRTMLILGILTLLTIGGLAIFLAARKNGDTYNTVQNLTYQQIQNNYFTNLIATGVTTEKDLEAITDIRPYGSLFIGISKEPMTLEQAQGLAKRTGAEILHVKDSKFGSSQELTAWLNTSYPSFPGSAVWIQQAGASGILDGQTARPAEKDEQARKVFLQWQGPDSLQRLAEKEENARNSASSTIPPRAATKEHPFVNSLGMKFVPVPGTNVLFCIHDTRKGDYRKYAAAVASVDNSWNDPKLERVPVPASEADDHPVVNVSWEDAKAFCAWLSEKEGHIYRLPKDHEWSVAVGIGAQEDEDASPESKSEKIKGIYPWGSAWPPPARAGNFNDSAYSQKFPWVPLVIEGYHDGYITTSPVMSFTPNKLGLYDISGNVWQWCEDWYNNEHNFRILRGGSWDYDTRGILLSSFRERATPGTRENFNGFRCVLVGAGSP